VNDDRTPRSGRLGDGDPPFGGTDADGRNVARSARPSPDPDRHLDGFADCYFDGFARCYSDGFARCHLDGDGFAGGNGNAYGCREPDRHRIDHYRFDKYCRVADRFGPGGLTGRVAGRLSAR
jgi:hypothetical protein